MMFFFPSRRRTLHRKLLSACLFPALLCVWLHLSIRVVLLRFNPLGLHLFSSVSLCYVIPLQCHVSLSGTFTLGVFLSFPVFFLTQPTIQFSLWGWVNMTHTPFLSLPLFSQHKRGCDLSVSPSPCGPQKDAALRF